MIAELTLVLPLVFRFADGVYCRVLMLGLLLCVGIVAHAVAGEEASTIEIVDPNPALLSDAGELITPDTAEHTDAFAGALPICSGVVADGVSMLLLRLPASNSVTFSIWPVLGSLRPLDSDGTGARMLTVTPRFTSDGTPWAFAVYIPPNDLPGSHVRKTVHISVQNGSLDESIPLNIEAPPVVLVHGVWSNSSTWDGLREFLAARGFRLCESADCTVNYGAVQPAPSFDPFAADQFAVDELIRATTNTLRTLRAEGIAAAQVDIIGHSLGGLIARSRVARQDSERAYLRRDNFGRGDFHKLISIGTPHRGTAVANFLIANRNVRSAFFDGATLEEYLASTGRPVGPAIEQMQTNSAALENLGATIGVPSHAILGIAPRRSHTEELLNMLPGALGYFLSFDSLLGGNQANDVLVPRSSQEGGLLRPAVTRVRGTVHADLDGRDTGETESRAIWRRVVQLLHAPSESRRFGNFTAAFTNGVASTGESISVGAFSNSEH